MKIRALFPSFPGPASLPAFMPGLLTCFGALLASCGPVGEESDSESAYGRPEIAVASAQANGSGEFVLSETDEASSGSAADAAQSVERKIIYSSDVHLVLKKTNFEEFDKEIRSLLEKHEGYHSLVTFEGNRGYGRSGKWVLRVPVRHYQAFVAAVKDLGVPELVQENSQDVTDEFVDLDARLTNQKRLEDRILQVLDQVSGKIGEVLEVERELSRVREVIERLEGRMRQLNDRISMTTVRLFVREDEDYQPPQALSFGEEMGESWSGSIAAMKNFFKELTLLIIALSPWMLILFVLLLLIRSLFRSLLAKRAKASTEKAS